MSDASDITIQLRRELGETRERLLETERLSSVVATDLTEKKKHEETKRRLHAEMETRITQRIADLAVSRLAALSMMEEAVESAKAIEAANQTLQHEIIEREHAEAQVRQANAELERRVDERSAQLGEANRILKQRANELEEANKELESFSYSVSHDLRAPLRYISGFAGLLRASIGPGLTDQNQHYLEEINGSAKQMGRLIDELLQFSRTGRIELRRQRLDLTGLVEEGIQQLRLEANGRSIQWKKHPLPTVQADSTLLYQVVVNLLGNAIKYTRPRDPAQIEIGCASQNGQEIVIFVRDNGVGFDMQYADKLFGVFQRLHLDEEFEGTGVGLAIVRRIIVRHGGRTWAEGKVNEGATFYFSLPSHHP